ncbi:hypothetical protein N5079_30325 [Planotetraspora sp. A-T 1434]|uniref:hypothetical protein n=1 Tax=Planotetraspora sp. A-T 1434 TaxID=2979219 RepID=UPI0021C069F4|nr:hypothetical protein [Planotetraspora sp. A-T 1434]MCT9934510.1 hypothetical protein [Planotetraspora sp. A-T 1434]
MTATFGDFVDGARVHLEIAQRHAQTEIHLQASAETLHAGRSLTTMLARCADDFAHSAAVAVPLQKAADLLARWEPNPASALHPVPLHLSTAGLAWGAAGDVLATHFSPQMTHARSDWTRVITDNEVRRQLLHEVGSHALALSAILDRTAHAHAPEIRAARELLTSPDVVEASRLGGSAVVRAIPLNDPAPPAAIPTAPQTPDELRAGITTSTNALRALCHHKHESGPREWHRTALAGSIITHITARLLTQLTRRAYELNPDRRHDLGQALQRVANGLEEAHAEWKDVRRAWQGLFPRGPLDRSQRQQHLEQVTVLLGRLLHTNPLWTPAQGDAPPIKSPAQTARNTAEMVPPLRSTLNTCEALVAIAEQDQRDLTRALRDGRLPREGTQDLLAAYEELTRPKLRTSWAISEAIFLSADPAQRPALWPEIHALELRRDSPALTKQATRQRQESQRWLEWLSTRPAVADTRLDLPVRGDSTSPPAATRSISTAREQPSPSRNT